MFDDLVSIIIPTYSRSNMLPRAITSVLSQTYKNIEVIVVDDNGINSDQQIETYNSIKHLLVDPRVKYVRNEVNLGGSGARNTGINHSNGEYITFLDDDDEYYNNKIKSQIEFYKVNFPDKGGFINSQVDVYKNGRKIRTTNNHVDYSNLLYSAVSEKILGTPTFFLPREVILSVGGFPVISKGQEWYLSVKLVENGYKFLQMSSSTVKVNIHDEGSIFNGNSDSKKQISGINNVYNIQKNYFHLFSRKEINYIKHRYLLHLARAYSSSNLIRSFIIINKSLLYSFPKRDFFATLYRIFIK